MFACRPDITPGQILALAVDPANNKVLIATLISDSVVLILAAYDLFSTGKLHRATLWAGISLIVAQQLRFPIAQTTAWHAIATWALSIANSLHGT